VKALSTDPEWRSWDAYSTFTPEEKRHRITSGPLGGARGLGGYQRIFHNAKTGEFITVVWIGSALSGWPGVTHGGVTATILDESMGRCAIARFPVQTGMTAYLNFNFVKPVRTRGFCVVRANPIVDRSTERKGFVKGRLESLNGDALVLAEGLFVIPKNLPPSALKPIELSNPDVGF
jgi:acyl-coenzyme A thioesterase PaaI-like protein